MTDSILEIIVWPVASVWNQITGISSSNHPSSCAYCQPSSKEPTQAHPSMLGLLMFKTLCDFINNFYNLALYNNKCTQKRKVLYLHNEVTSRITDIPTLQRHCITVGAGHRHRRRTVGSTCFIKMHFAENKNLKKWQKLIGRDSTRTTHFRLLFQGELLKDTMMEMLHKEMNCGWNNVKKD